VDEHSLLLFINHCATRCKHTSKGIEIPNTLIGAVSFLDPYLFPLPF
jgi:hypothetical protein